MQGPGRNQSNRGQPRISTNNFFSGPRKGLLPFPVPPNQTMQRQEGNQWRGGGPPIPSLMNKSCLLPTPSHQLPSMMPVIQNARDQIGLAANNQINLTALFSTMAQQTQNQDQNSQNFCGQNLNFVNTPFMQGGPPNPQNFAGQSFFRFNPPNNLRIQVLNYQKPNNFRGAGQGQIRGGNKFGRRPIESHRQEPPNRNRKPDVPAAKNPVRSSSGPSGSSKPSGPAASSKKASPNLKTSPKASTSQTKSTGDHLAKDGALNDGLSKNDPCTNGPSSKDSSKDNPTTDTTQKELKKEKYDSVPLFRLVCHLCNLQLPSPYEFEEHLNSKIHDISIKKKEEEYVEKIQGMREKIKMDEEIRQREMPPSYPERLRRGINRDYCQMCDVMYAGSLATHRKSGSHQDLKAFLYPKCIPCAQDFHSRIEWDRHRLSAEHLAVVSKHSSPSTERAGGVVDKNKRDDNACNEKAKRQSADNPASNPQKGVSGQESENHEEGVGAAKIVNGMNAPPSTVVKNESGDSVMRRAEPQTSQKQPGAPKRKLSTDLKEPVRLYDPDKEFGKEALMKKTGYVCVSCNCFLPSDDAAKIHCKTRPHFDKHTARLKNKERNLMIKKERTKSAERSRSALSENPARVPAETSSAEKSCSTISAKPVSTPGESDRRPERSPSPVSANPLTPSECAKDFNLDDQDDKDLSDQDDNGNWKRKKKRRNMEEEELWQEVDKDLGMLMNVVDSDNQDQ